MSIEITDLLASHGLAMAILLAGLAVALLVRQAVRRRRTLEACLTRLSDLQAMVSACGQSLIAMDAAISRLDSRITEFTEHNLEIQSRFAFNRAFEEASRMVRDGSSADSLVAACGLSDAEAALMVRLHQAARPRTDARPAAAPGLTVDPGVQRLPAQEPDQELAEEEIRLREVLRAARSA